MAPLRAVSSLGGRQISPRDFQDRGGSAGHTLNYLIQRAFCRSAETVAHVPPHVLACTGQLNRAGYGRCEMPKTDLTAQAARLAKRFEAIPSAILAEVRPALMQSAEDLAQSARVLAPEDEGGLKASIVVTGLGQMTPAYAEGGGKRTASENQARVTVGTPEQRHGRPVEFGTEAH